MRIQEKYLLCNAAGAIAVLVLFSLYMMSQHLEREEWQLRDRIYQTASLIRGLNHDPLIAGNQRLVESNCRTFFEDAAIVRLYVHDVTGRVEVDLVRSSDVFADDLIEHRFTVLHDGYKLADVEMMYTTALIRDRLALLRNNMITLTTLLLIVLYGAYTLISRSFAKPIRQLMGAMKRVDEGDYSTRIAWNRSDEMGQIVEYFNAMVHGIEISGMMEKEYLEQLESKTRELQDKISEQEVTEEALRQSQKMEAVGRLAGGVAHDFNNLLTSILGFGSMVQKELAEDHPAYRDVEEIVRAGGRACELTQQLLALARKKQLDQREIDVNVVIRGLVALLHRTLGADIELVTDMEEDVGSVMADAGSIEQVIANLALNSRDAMPEGGTLTIRSARVTIDEDTKSRFADIRAGTYVLITVRDTGDGIPPDIQEHIFEPFYTTKGEGEGTGLGLSTAYVIIRQCNGHIEMESDVAKGTEFRIYLPMVSEESPTMGVQLEIDPERGDETILLVEDEDSVRLFATQLLRSLGYTILDARCGGEAVQLAAEHVGKIDLILTDVVMPQLSGPDMVEQIAAVRNGFKVLYMSGFTQDRTLPGAGGAPAPLLRKPFTPDILAQRVRQVLNAN